MCLTHSPVRNLGRWNWDGDRILHRSVLASSRPVPGYPRGTTYAIDAREFLVTERNEVMRRALEEDVRTFVLTKMPGAGWDLFRSRAIGSFDHRADVVAAFVADAVRYVRRPGKTDPWQFPDETLAVRGGDCEDRALLIASLLLASGVSPYNVRVALGHVEVTPAGRGRALRRDHVWVMYKTESGRWALIEPLHTKRVDRSAAGAKLDVRVGAAAYVPRFLFNDQHLWHVNGPGAGADGAAEQEREDVELCQDWSTLHPQFAGAVHKTILNDALAGVCPAWLLSAFNRHFSAAVLGLIGPTVDDVDRDPALYDPRDHFDNGYVDEGWARVADRLRRFRDAPAANVYAFFKAAHGIADFYAHTSYCHFARADPATDVPVPYDPADPGPCFRVPPVYDGSEGFDLSSGAFTRNPAVWKGDAAGAAAAWNGRLISGRYAQVRDTHGGLVEHLAIEGPSNIPAELRRRADFASRGALPHHNEIAVDDRARGGEHRLYADPAEYARQYRRRTRAATAHIRQAFVANWPSP
jgi:hypothetical protein